MMHELGRSEAALPERWKRIANAEERVDAAAGRVPHRVASNCRFKDVGVAAVEKKREPHETRSPHGLAVLYDGTSIGLNLTEPTDNLTDETNQLPRSRCTARIGPSFRKPLGYT
jgi:hypothetical protein